MEVLEKWKIGGISDEEYFLKSSVERFSQEV
jgi:hypothetical protein